MEQGERTCPLCHNNCPEGAPLCPRGQAYFGKEQPRQHKTSHGWGEWPPATQAQRAKGRSRKVPSAFRDRIPADSLTGLLMRSGHYLFNYLHMGHQADEAAFSALTEDEKAALQEMLMRLLVAWKQEQQ